SRIRVVAREAANRRRGRPAHRRCRDDLHRRGLPAAVQHRYNLAERGAEPALDYRQREGIGGFIPWFPMATSDLARRGGPPQQIADELRVTPAHVAVAAFSSLAGTSTVAHLEENAAVALIELTPDQVQQLDAAI